MRVIKATVDQKIFVVDVDFSNMDTVYEHIGGFEIVRTAELRSFFHAPVVIICDDNGWAHQKEINLIASAFYGGPGIPGDVLFALEQYGEFVDFDDVDATCEYMNSLLEV